MDNLRIQLQCTSIQYNLSSSKHLFCRRNNEIKDDQNIYGNKDSFTAISPGNIRNIFLNYFQSTKKTPSQGRPNSSLATCQCFFLFLGGHLIQHQLHPLIKKHMSIVFSLLFSFLHPFTVVYTLSILNSRIGSEQHLDDWRRICFPTAAVVYGATAARD